MGEYFFHQGVRVQKGKARELIPIIKLHVAIPVADCSVTVTKDSLTLERLIALIRKKNFL